MLGRNPVENFRWKDDLSEPEMSFPVSFVVALQASQPLAVRVSATGCYGVRLTLGDRLDENRSVSFATRCSLSLDRSSTRTKYFY